MIHIERSYPPPESLKVESCKANGQYNKPDVVERLRKDFYDKCYICEIKDLQDPQVEHLLPHRNGQYAERKFDWDNLFWSCGHCNQIKNNSKYNDGILNCCKVDPEQCISQELSGDSVAVHTLDCSDDAAIRTASLIEEAFNLRDHGIRTAGCDVRLKALQLEMNKLYRLLRNYRNSPESCTARLRVLLKKESAFAGFKRYYVRKCYPELRCVMD